MWHLTIPCDVAGDASYGTRSVVTSTVIVAVFVVLVFSWNVAIVMFILSLFMGAFTVVVPSK